MAIRNNQKNKLYLPYIIFQGFYIIMTHNGATH